MVVRCGYVSIIGRPNVGKSTLLNALIGQKLGMTSHKPQTTRHRLLGIKTLENENAQIAYVDTPGIHRKKSSVLNRYLNKSATQAMHDVDVIVWVTEGMQCTPEDEWALAQAEKSNIPIFWLINKIDKLHDRNQLLPLVAKISAQHKFAQVFPVSAYDNTNLSEFEKALIQYLPESEEFYFPPDQVTDRSDAFFITEIVREKLTRILEQELPYLLTVTLEQFEKNEKLVTISAVIWVNEERQKPIVIGEKGARLKQVGIQARHDLEIRFNTKVMLKLWVKVRENWADNKEAIQSLGYD